MISYGNGFILQSEKYSRENAGESLKNYTLLFKGEMAYNHGASKNKPYGVCYELKESESARVPFVYHTFKIIKGDSKYWNYALNLSAIDRQLKKLVSSGARMDGLLNISYDEYMSINIFEPCIEEQHKIAIFLSKIDERIETQSKIIKDLKLLKNSIIDYVLDSEDLQEFTLNELIVKKYLRTIKASELEYFKGERKYLSTSSINENGIISYESFITFENKPSRASMKPIYNSVWFAKMKNSIKVFKASINDENTYILSTGFYGILVINNLISPDWLLEIFKSNYFNNQKNKFSEGSSMSGIKDSQLSDIKIKIFSDNISQSKWLHLFKLLNMKLSREIKLLEKYKEQKKFMLSNMFI